jgi:hypothetical protein
MPMGERSILEIHRYVYLDAVGLQSLWVQANDRTESKAVTHERVRAEKVSASVGLARALGSLIGLVDVKAAAEAEPSKQPVHRARSSLAAEQKLKLLVKSLREAGPPFLYDTFDTAAAAATALRNAVFCLAHDVFDAPQFYAPTDGVAIANQMGALLFERNRRPAGVFDSYRYDDQYYRVETSKTGAPIIMAASLTK